MLAIDAGNSKTDVALVAADGTVLGTARGGGLPAAHRRARRSRGGARAAGRRRPPPTAGLASATSGPLVAARLGLPGQRRPAGRGRALVEAAIEAPRLGAVERYVGNDTFALLRAGVDEPPGVAVVCGAGINCAGLLAGRPDRPVRGGRQDLRRLGRRRFLWQEAMWWAARADDGRGPDTALARALPAHFGCPDDGRADRGVAPRHDLRRIAALELTPLLFEVAARGDEVATRRSCCARPTRSSRSPSRRCAGSNCSTSRRRRPRRRRAHRRAPRCCSTASTSSSRPGAQGGTRVVTTPPVVGAALLGLDHIGATADAQARLRSTAAKLLAAPTADEGATSP